MNKNLNLNILSILMNKLDYFLINNILSYLDFRSQIKFVQIDKFTYYNFKQIIRYHIGTIIKKKLKILKFDKYTKLRLKYYNFYFIKKISNMLLNIKDDNILKSLSKLKSSKNATNNLVYYKYLTLYNVKSMLENYNFPITKKHKINAYIKKHFYNVYCLIDFL